jgi:hypothetical protein
VLGGTLDDLGATAPVRRLVGHDVSEADVARIAATLGLHAAPTRTDWGYEVRDGDALLMVETESGATWIDYSSAGNAGVDATGGSSAGSGGTGSSDPSTGTGVAEPANPAPDAPVPDGSDTPVDTEPLAPLPTIPPPVDVPNADDAVQIAQSLLDDLGALDGQQWAHDVTDTSTDDAIACASDAPCPEPAPAPVSQRTVTFDPVIDGIRVPGVGWSVTIGSHRKVEALLGTWATSEPAGSYALRPTTAVFDDLQNGRARYIGVQPLTANAAAEGSAADAIEPGVVPEPGPIAPPETRITGVSLGIARWDGTEGGRPVVYLVPTYLFHASEFHAGSGDTSYDIELLALDPKGFTIADLPTDVPPADVPAVRDPEIGVPPGEVVTPPAPAPQPAEDSPK